MNLCCIFSFDMLFCLISVAHIVIINKIKMLLSCVSILGFGLAVTKHL